MIDLVPREAVEKWLTYLREELPAVAFKCSTQQQRSNLGWKSSKGSKTSNILQTSDCLGADTLIKLLKNYTRSQEVRNYSFIHCLIFFFCSVVIATNSNLFLLQKNQIDCNYVLSLVSTGMRPSLILDMNHVSWVY